MSRVIQPLTGAWVAATSEPGRTGRAGSVGRGGVRSSGRRHQKALDAGDFAVEVARVERQAPDGLVDLSPFSDGERLRAEQGCERGVLDLRAGPLETVAKDRRVVAGRPASLRQHRTVPHCWEEHWALLEELSALRTAWLTVFAVTSPGDASLDWHANFAAARLRLIDWISHSGCRVGEHRPDSASG